MPTSTETDTYQPTLACTEPDVDPDWWTGNDHPGVCAKGCVHGLAAHICLTHCAFREQCQDMLMMNETEFVGMVTGGLMRIQNTRRNGRGYSVQVPKTLRLSCELCKRRAPFVS